MKKVLVGVEAAEDAQQVLQAAVEELQSSDAGAEVFVLYVDPLLDARVIFDPGSVDAARDWYSRVESDPRLQGRVRRTAGEPVTAICEAASAEGADLIMMAGTRHRRLLRNRSTRIARYAPCEVRYVGRASA